METREEWLYRQGREREALGSTVAEIWEQRHMTTDRAARSDEKEVEVDFDTWLKFEIAMAVANERTRITHAIKKIIPFELRQAVIDAIHPKEGKE